MAKNRKIVDITIGYIIGIIWGLYLKLSIVLLYLIIFLISKILKFTKISRYTRLVMTPITISLIIISSIVSSTIVKCQNNKYENLYNNVNELTALAQVIDNGKEKEYKTVYKIKINQINGNKKFKETYLYLNVNDKQNLEYGDYIYIEGEYTSPNISTNYKGFNYKEYLKTLKIHGTINANNIEVLDKSTNNFIFEKSNKIFLNIKNVIQENFNDDISSVLLGVLLGYTDNIEENIKQNFSDSNLSHVLAVSGMHVSYIILSISFILNKLLGKKYSKIITIAFLILYMFITGFSPSVVRAGLMGILILISKIIYRKNDIWTSISLSLLALLIYNPFLIKSISVLLSYLATIGIILFQKNILKVFKSIKIRKKGHIYRPKIVINKNLEKIINYIFEILSVSFSVQITIFPITVMYFNTFGITFFITNFLVSLIIGPIIILGFIFILISLIKINHILKIQFIIRILVSLLIKISELGSKLPLAKILIVTPSIWQVIAYYIFIYIANFIYSIWNFTNQKAFYQRIKNLIYLIKYKIRKNRNICLFVIILIYFLITIFSVIPKDLKIYFIDVGQGDSTLIVTPYNQKILIDGGGSTTYDVGEKILVPYLLDRKIKKIDYIIISHFDTDHVRAVYLL